MIFVFLADASHADVDYRKIAAPIKSAVDKFQLVPEFLKVIGICIDVLMSRNYLRNGRCSYANSYLSLVIPGARASQAALGFF